MPGTNQARQAADPTGLNLVEGTYEEALDLMGLRTDVYFGQVVVEEASVRYYAAAIEDANPGYWDSSWATHQWGGVVAPPGMLLTLSKIRLPWTPEPEPRPNLMAQIRAPGTSVINVETDVEFYRPFVVGTRFNVVDEFADISPERQTRLGTGHFLTIVSRFRDQDGRDLARATNVMLRFTPRSEGM